MARYASNESHAERLERHGSTRIAAGSRGRRYPLAVRCGSSSKCNITSFLITYEAHVGGTPQPFRGDLASRPAFGSAFEPVQQSLSVPTGRFSRRRADRMRIVRNQDVLYAAYQPTPTRQGSSGVMSFPRVQAFRNPVSNYPRRTHDRSRHGFFHPSGKFGEKLQCLSWSRELTVIVPPEQFAHLS